VVTDRLELRQFRDTDVDALAAVFAKPDVWRYPYGRGRDRSETAVFVTEMARERDERGFGCWIAIERETGVVVGYLGLSVPAFLPEVLPAVEVGWRLDPAHWGRGLATEGARAALLKGFTTLGLDEIISIVQVENSASLRVAERLGMRLDREVQIPANERRGRLDALLYTMSREEWMSCI